MPHGRPLRGRPCSPLGRESAGLRHYAPSHLLPRCSASYQHLRCAAGRLQIGLTRPYRSPQASVQRRKLFPAPINLRCRTPFAFLPAVKKGRTAFLGVWVRGAAWGEKPSAAITNCQVHKKWLEHPRQEPRRQSSAAPSLCETPSRQNSPPYIRHMPSAPHLGPS